MGERETMRGREGEREKERERKRLDFFNFSSSFLVGIKPFLFLNKKKISF